MESALDAGETKMPLSQPLPSVNSESRREVSSGRDEGTMWHSGAGAMHRVFGARRGKALRESLWRREILC